MSKNHTLTATRVREVLDYDTETGDFRWKVNLGRRIKAGGAAGSVDARGYRHIGIDGTKYLAHRLAWLHVQGVWPVEQIDHRNGIPGDNRLVNLREATHAENMQNLRPFRKTNTSGVTGASRHGSAHRWAARIRFNGRCVHLGHFDTAEEASAAYIAAKRTIHPFWEPKG